MIRGLALALALACLPAAAQIPAPDTWRKESFQFPLLFAPSLPYEGIEHIRFAPYWTQFATDRGFSYVVLWDIKHRTLEAAEIERALDVYFDGLMEAISRVRKVDDPGTVSSVALHPMAAPKGWSEALGGRLWTWNGFSKGEPLVLNLEVAQRPCGEDRTQVFFAFSRAPRADATWEELRSLREATDCALKPPS